MGIKIKTTFWDADKEKIIYVFERFLYFVGFLLSIPIGTAIIYKTWWTLGVLGLIEFIVAMILWSKAKWDNKQTSLSIDREIGMNLEERRAKLEIEKRKHEERIINLRCYNCKKTTSHAVKDREKMCLRCKKIGEYNGN